MSPHATQPHPTRSLSLAVGLLALAWTVGCAHSPDTHPPKTDEGTETVTAPTPTTLFSIARILEARGRDADCERLLRQIMKDHQDYLPTYGVLANLLVRQHRIDQATDVLKAGLKEAPRDPVLLNNMGMCHVLLKQYPEALGYFKQAGTVNPENTRYRANQALVLALNGDLQRAQALYETFLTPRETQQNLDIIRKTRNSQGHAIPRDRAKDQAP